MTDMWLPERGGSRNHGPYQARDPARRVVEGLGIENDQWRRERDVLPHPAAPDRYGVRRIFSTVAASTALRLYGMGWYLPAAQSASRSL